MENENALQLNSSGTDTPQPANAAPWYCVLPLIALGAVPPLYGMIRPDASLGLCIWLTVVAVFCYAVCIAKKQIIFMLRPVQAAAALYAVMAVVSWFCSAYRQAGLGATHLESTAMMVCCAVGIILLSGTKLPDWALGVCVWAVMIVITVRTVLDDLSYLGLKSVPSDIMLTVPAMAFVFVLLAGNLGRGKLFAAANAFVCWLVLALLVASAAKTDPVTAAAAFLAGMIILAAVHFRFAARGLGAAALFAAVPIIVLGFAWNTWKPKLEHLTEPTAANAQLIDIVTEENSVVFTSWPDTAGPVQPSEDPEDAEPAELPQPVTLRTVLNSAEGSEGLAKADFSDAEGSKLALKESETDPKIFLINVEPYHSLFKLCIIRRNDTNVLRIEYSGQNWDLALAEGEAYYLNSKDELTKLKGTTSRPAAAGPRFTAERRAVWPYAAALANAEPLTGYGAGSFPLLHAEDPVYRFKCGLDPSATEEDPKSLYLAGAVQNGYVSLAAMAAVFIFYAVSYIRQLHSEAQPSARRHQKAAIFAALLCLLAAGAVNTPQTGTMPLFYMLIGIGLAADYKDTKGGTTDGI